MRAEKGKRAFAFLIIIALGMFNEAVFAKQSAPEKLMQESLGNSTMYAEFPNSNEIVPIETKEDHDNKVILGSVETTIDINLENCIRLALGNNPRIRAAMSEVLAANTRIAQAWSNYFPTFTWQTSAAKIRQLELEDALSEILVYNYYLLGQIGLYQMLYDFGVTQNQVTIKKLSYEEYKKALTETINDVIYRTKDGYYNLLYAYDKQRIAGETVEKYEAFYNQAKAFYEIGLKMRGDVVMAQVNLSKAKFSQIQAENDVDRAIANLNKQMGVPYKNRYNVKERLDFKPVKVTLDDSIEIARTSRPDYKKAELKVEEANQVVKLAKKAYMPTLSLQANYARGGGGWNKNYGYLYGIYLNFPNMNIMLNQNQIKESKCLYSREVANAQETKNTIYLEIQNAYYQLDEKRKQLPAAFLQIKYSVMNYELQFGRYREGIGTVIEFKDAATSLEESKLAYYKCLYEYNSAKSLLEKSIGKNLTAIED